MPKYEWGKCFCITLLLIISTSLLEFNFFLIIDYFIAGINPRNSLFQLSPFPSGETEAQEMIRFCGSGATVTWGMGTPFLAS